MRRLPVVALMIIAATLSGCGSDDHTVGDAVEVDFYPQGGSDPNGSGTVEVTEIRAGTTDQLEQSGFDLDPAERAAKVYYVDVTFNNESDATVLPHDVGGEDPDGNLIDSLVVLDFGDAPFAPCPGIPEELAAGQEGKGCTIILVPNGTEMEKVYYHPGGSADFVYWTLG